MYFEGWENNYNTFWAWEYLNTTYVVPGSSTSTKSFTLNSYSHTFYDANRTCSVTYKGILYTKTVLGWVPANSTQYADFIAAK